MSVKKIVKVILTTAFLVAVLFQQHIYANGDTSTVHSFYNNPRNATPQQNTVDKGLDYFVRFSAKNTLTGATEYSSENWNTSNNYDIYARVSNNADVYDMTNSTNLSLEGQFKNTIDKEITVSMSVELPANLLSVDQTRLTTNPVTGSYSEKFVVRYHYKGQNYTYEELMALPNFSWSDVINVSFSGKLGANEVAQFNLPVALKTSTPDTINVRVRSYSPSRQSTWVRIRASKYMYTVDDMMTGVYVGAYRETVNGIDTYKKIPSHIQKLMPTVQKSDFVYDMFTTLYFAGQQGDLTRKSDGVAYDHSTYLIATDRIFNAVKDHGYSVYADNARGLWNAYAYYMGSNLKFFDADGNAVELGRPDADSGTQFSDYYVELHKVFDTKDIVINVGESWDQFDNLIYRQSVALKGSDSHVLSDDEIKVTHNVDNMTPGVYNVTYAHEVAPNKIVTITAKVTVLGKYNANYTFESDTPNQTLPKEVLDLLPNTQSNLSNGTVVTAQQPSVTEIVVNGGKWVFKGYDNGVQTINNQDITFTGKWQFVAEQTTDTTTTTTNTTATRVVKKAKLPKTGDNTVILLPVGAVLVILAIVLFVLRRKSSRKK